MADACAVAGQPVTAVFALLEDFFVAEVKLKIGKVKVVD